MGPERVRSFVRDADNRTELAVVMDFDPALHEQYGAPARAFALYAFEEARIELKLIVGAARAREA